MMGWNDRYRPAQLGRATTKSVVNQPPSRPLPADRPEVPGENPSANTTPEQLRNLSLQTAASGEPSPDFQTSAFSERGY